MTARKGSRAEAAAQVAAIARGGLGAIIAAEALLDEGTNINVRTTAARKRVYAAAAEADGLTLSKLVLKLLDEHISR